jgi:hypothetical protein
MLHGLTGNRLMKRLEQKKEGKRNTKGRYLVVIVFIKTKKKEMLTLGKVIKNVMDLVNNHSAFL